MKGDKMKQKIILNNHEKGGAEQMEKISKICPYCNKVIESLYTQQLKYNYEAHLLACKVNPSNNPNANK